MEKIKTGIPGLDEVLNGGIRRTISVLLTGVPGTGKTLFGMHYIYHGAKEGEPGLFITYEEDEPTVIQYAESFGLDYTLYVKKGLITLVHQQISGKVLSLRSIIETIKRKKITRVFLDSLTLFEYANLSDTHDFRKEVLEFLKTMKLMGVTLLATYEKRTAHIDNLSYGPEDFVFEGLIILTKIRKGASFERCLSVAKMRAQSHLLGIYPFSISEKGIEVYPKQIPFSLLEKDSLP